MTKEGLMESETLRFDREKEHPFGTRQLLLGQRKLVQGNLILVQASGRSMVYSVPENPDWRTTNESATLMDEADHRCLVTVGLHSTRHSGCRWLFTQAIFLADDVSKIGPLEFCHPTISDGKLVLNDIKLELHDRLLVQWPNKSITLHHFWFAGIRIGNSAGPRFWIEVNFHGKNIKVPLGTPDSPKLFLLPRK
jgi:hypothetical protein